MMKNDAQEKINQLQMLEYNMHNLSSQRQQFHNQLLEIESAVSDLEGKEKAFKIVGNIMVEQTVDELKKDLDDKKERLQLRIKSIEKQENSFKEKAEKLQKDVMDSMKE